MDDEMMDESMLASLFQPSPNSRSSEFKSKSQKSNNNKYKVLKFVVGNTYNRLSKQDAKLDRTGKHPKIHDWCVYVDFLMDDDDDDDYDGANPIDMIDSVTFDMGHTFHPRRYTKYYPIKLETKKQPQQGGDDDHHRKKPPPQAVADDNDDDSNDKKMPAITDRRDKGSSGSGRRRSDYRFRFQSRQQSYDTLTIQITITSTFGQQNQSTIPYQIVLNNNNNNSNNGGNGNMKTQYFVVEKENLPNDVLHSTDICPRPIPTPLPSNVGYSLELEFLQTTTTKTNTKTIMATEAAASAAAPMVKENGYDKTLSDILDRFIERKNSSNMSHSCWNTYVDPNSNLLVLSSSSLSPPRDSSSSLSALNRNNNNEKKIRVGEENLSNYNSFLTEAFNTIGADMKAAEATTTRIQRRAIKFIPRIRIYPKKIQQCQRQEQFQGKQQHQKQQAAVSSVDAHKEIDLELHDLCKICQNYVKYEDAIDKIIPIHSLSIFDDDNDPLPLSNKVTMITGGVGGNSTSTTPNKERHAVLDKCQTIPELVNCINPGRLRRSSSSSDPIYKLNLVGFDNRKKDDSDTVGGASSLGDTINSVSHNDINHDRFLEFRYGVVTHCFDDNGNSSSNNSSNGKTVQVLLDLIRFSCLFVSNTLSYKKKPSYLKESRTRGDQLLMMLDYVVKDRHLSSSLFCIIDYDDDDSSRMSIDDDNDHLYLNDDSTDVLLSPVDVATATTFRNVSESSCDSGSPLSITGNASEKDQSFESSLPVPDRKRLRAHPYNEACEGSSCQRVSNEDPSPTNQHERVYDPLPMLPHPGDIPNDFGHGAFGHALLTSLSAQTATTYQQPRPPRYVTSYSYLPLRKVTKTELQEYLTGSEPKSTVTSLQLGFILGVINAPKDRDKTKRIEELLKYSDTKPKGSFDLIIAPQQNGSSPRHFSVGRGGAKFSRIKYRAEDVESKLDFEEISAVLEAIGNPRPQTLEQAISDLDSYVDKESSDFHFLVQFMKKVKIPETTIIRSAADETPLGFT